MMDWKTILILISLLGYWHMNPSSLQAAPGVKMRARENFEQIAIKTPIGSYQYQSFSHTFNIWWENPFHWALGIATGPYIMTYPQRQAPAVDTGNLLGKKIRIQNHGLEFKKWFQGGGIFARVGVYKTLFDSHTPSGLDTGSSALVGLGYEYNWDGIGLAFEADLRHGILAKTKHEINVVMVAIGVHFYSYL